jgi:hypothetical protein
MSTPGNALLLAPSTSPSDRSSEFVPVVGGQETTSAEGLLITAYVLMWAVVFGLIWLSLRRLRAVDQRLAVIEVDLAQQDAEQRTRRS